ncbi:formyltransferase family protein [Actinosynnema sp. NPDC051121]
MGQPFFVMTEDTFHAGYLVTRWLDEFAGHADFGGVVLREDPLPEELTAAREDFHRRYEGKTELATDEWRELLDLYPRLTTTERAMISEFGVPGRSVAHSPGTTFIGLPNGPRAQEWLTRQCEAAPPYVFIFIDKVLAPWWIDLTDGRVLNGHSAVLPHARGIYSIEQIAAAQDVDLFRDAAGATVHYIDNGVDTGPIVRVEKFREPFGFDSVWSCKAHAFMLTFDLLVDVARDLGRRPGTTPAGVVPSPSPHGAAEFTRAGFRRDRHAAAEAGYLAMRTATGNAGP